MSNFERAFGLVIGSEGGYVNNPADPGGETKFGISKKAYPALDIAGLTLDQAQGIYKRDYWDKLSLDSQPWHVSYLVFDCSVNQGLGKARALLAAAPSKASPDFQINFQAERALHYAGLPTFPTFGRGWMRRLMNGFGLSLQEG